MLFSQGHGSQPFIEKAESLSLTAAGDSPTFRYYFPNADEMPHSSDTAEKLDSLAKVIVSQTLPTGEENSRIPPVFTYLGQFIDHDITAGTNSKAGEFDSTVDQLEPLPRNTVTDGLTNLRSGVLDLDSLYGDNIGASEFAEKLTKLMRHPVFPGKMRIAFTDQITSPNGEIESIHKPADGASDLLRLGNLINRGLTSEEILALDDKRLRQLFVVEDDNGKESLNIHRAIIGDGRNDENLFIAQLQLAMLRFHNRQVDTCSDQAVIDGGSDSLFAWARQQVKFHYQWLVVNEYLQTICLPSVVEQVIDNEAALYGSLLAQFPVSEGRLPLPIEFSAAGFRFGHSMVRNNYVWNRFFTDQPGAKTEASLTLLFLFTGGSPDPMPTSSSANLPSNWPADWSRLAATNSAFPNRSARKIDTFLAHKLGNLSEDTASGPTAQDNNNLASLNLRKGHLLNLPSAQSCLAGIEAITGIVLPKLTDTELTSGPAGQAMIAANVVSETPLWLYVLREAELTTDGQSLGALGSYLVADTLMGLIINDPQSYWNHSGSVNGRWHPQDGNQPEGEAVTSVPALLRAALLL